MAMSNAVNLTDGLDGLATGTSVMVHRRVRGRRVLAVPALGLGPELHRRLRLQVRDPLEIAIIAGAAAAACFGFLWWNASPARIFMGDTGSLALGGLIAGLAFATRTVLLLPILGILFTIITVTWVIQIGSYRSGNGGCSGWCRYSTTSSWPAGARSTSSSGSGSSPGSASPSSLGLFYADFLRVMEFAT